MDAESMPTHLAKHVDAALALYLNREGRQIHRSGDLSRARQYFSDAAEIDPSSTLAEHNLALIAQATGRRADAYQTFESIARNSDSPSFAADALIRLGNLYDEDGRRDEAYECYSRVLDIVADDTHIDEQRRLAGDALCGLGFVEHERGNLKRAEEFYRRAIEADQLSVAQVVNLAHCLYDLGDVSGAIGALTHALEIDPGSTENWRDLGDSHLHRGDRDAAKRCYLEALRRGDSAALELLLADGDRGEQP